MNFTISVDKSKCTDCGLCTRECLNHLPVYRDGGPRKLGMECIGCLHCYAVCPRGAVAVEGLEHIGNGNKLIDPPDLFALFAKRRSCREFEKRPIDAEDLAALTRAAAYGPSGGNSRSIRLTIITPGAVLDRLKSELELIYRKRKNLLGSTLLRFIFSAAADPHTRAFLRDRTYFKRFTYLLDKIAEGKDPIFYSAPAIALVHSPALIPTPYEDSVLAAHNMVLLAETMGIGSCFVSLAQNAVNSSTKCKSIIGLPSREQIYSVVVLGYPAVRYRRGVPREPILSRLPFPSTSKKLSTLVAV